MATRRQSGEIAPKTPLKTCSSRPVPVFHMTRLSFEASQPCALEASLEPSGEKVR
jgi:hypothetical protein